MKLAIQIVSWVMIAILGLMLLFAMSDNDTELLVGSIMYGILPILTVIYFHQNK